MTSEQMFTEHLLRARSCPRYWEYSSEQTSHLFSICYVADSGVQQWPRRPWSLPPQSSQFLGQGGQTSNSDYANTRSKLRGEGKDNAFLSICWVHREGFSKKVTWGRDLDGARTQPSGSLGKNVPG